MRDSGRDRDPAGCEVSRGSPARKRAHLGSASAEKSLTEEPSCEAEDMTAPTICATLKIALDRRATSRHDKAGFEAQHRFRGGDKSSTFSHLKLWRREASDEDGEPGERGQNDKAENDDALLAPSAQRRNPARLCGDGRAYRPAQRALVSKVLPRPSVKRRLGRWLMHNAARPDGPDVAARLPPSARPSLGAAACDPNENGDERRRKNRKRRRVGLHPAGDKRIGNRHFTGDPA